MDAEAVESVVRQLTERMLDHPWPRVCGQVAWLGDDRLAVYVRRCTRVFERERYQSLDIASISVHQRGRGTFTAFLERVLTLPGWEVLYIENVINPDLARYLSRNGFAARGDNTLPSFYLFHPDRGGRLPARLLRLRDYLPENSQNLS